MTRDTKAPAFAKLPELVANCGKQLINYARTRQRARQREKQRIGQNFSQLPCLSLLFPLSSALLSSSIINEPFYLPF